MSLVSKISKVVFNKLVPVEKTEFSLRDKICKIYYLNLKKSNKLHSLTAKAIREAAIKNNGEVRGHLRYLKNKEGQLARLDHVALCFLKGKKYSEVEPNVEKKNKLNVGALYTHLLHSVTREFAVVLKESIEKFLAE